MVMAASAVTHDLSISQFNHPVHTPGKRTVMGNHQNRLSLPNQRFKDLEDRFGCRRIQTAGGFIRQDQRRVWLL
jgi:predicted alpha/beta-hydrolase family hydrolase